MMGGNMEQFSPPAWVKPHEWLHHLLCSANGALQCIEMMGSKFPVWSIIFQENESSATPLQKPHISHEIGLSKAYQLSQKYFSAVEWEILASHEICHMNFNILTMDNIPTLVWNFDLNIIISCIHKVSTTKKIYSKECIQHITDKNNYSLFHKIVRNIFQMHFLLHHVWTTPTESNFYIIFFWGGWFW